MTSDMIEKFGLRIITFWKRVFNLPNQYELTSKSKNTKVIAVNQIIVDNEEVDSDYWDAIGNHLLLEEFSGFGLQDWTELELDLINWTSQQLWIFAEMLVREGNEIQTIDATALYAFIFTIVNNEDAADLSINLVEIDNGITKPAELLLSVRHRINSLRTSGEALQSDELYLERLNLIDDLLNRTESEKNISS